MLAKPELTQQEKDKIEIDPDIDFREIATRPWDKLSTNEIGMFKWSGVYHQLQTGYFMMRLRMPGGLLTSAQLRRAGELAAEYAQDEICITTRQCLQFHWLRKEDIYKVIEGMQETGITITNACGDVVRNVCTCPGMGVCSHELSDTADMLKKVADDPEFLEIKRNLPRKHKMAIAGCNAACGFLLLNCQGWAATEYTSPAGETKKGWIYYAGGGLGRNPYMAKKIFDFVPSDLVPAIARAGVEAHNRYGNRRLRPLARLKIIVSELGQKAFAALILNLMREQKVEGLDRIVIAESSEPEVTPIPFSGESVIPERTAGLNTVRVMIRRSELSGTEASFFADIAEKLGCGEIMFTHRHNLEIRGVKDSDIDQLRKILSDKHYMIDGFERLPDTVACVGTTMCNLAVSDTPKAYRTLLDSFKNDRDYWTKAGPIRINMNGCPNNCAHSWIADIGLRGRRMHSSENGSEEGFTLLAGGRTDKAGAIAQTIAEITATDAARAVRTLVDVFIAERESSEQLFIDFIEQKGSAEVSRLFDQAFHPPEHEQVNRRNLKLSDIFTAVVKEAK